MHPYRLVTAAAALVLLLAPVAAAQRSAVGTVTAAAPIFLYPDDTRVPLYVAPPDTLLRVLSVVDDEWLEVEFDDPSLGRRHGYVQSRFVRLARPDPRPVEVPGRDVPEGAARPTPPPPAAPADRRAGLRVHVAFDSTRFEAADSFEAITGASSALGFGFGATLTRVWRNLFIDVATAPRTLEGERVFVHAGTVFQLGIPVTIKMRPIDVAAGWRVARGRLAPFAGAGVSVISYDESSPFALPGDDVSERVSALLVLGGVDVVVWRWISLGGEVRYRSLASALAQGGVSEVFGDDQLGGISGAVRISFGR